ncbi:MAG: hypothetical protein AABX17_03070 [Nanoarchaeota archaeon]
MKRGLISWGLELLLAGCLAFSSANYSSRGEEQTPDSTAENCPTATTLKDEGLYQEVFKGTIKEPEKLTKNPEKTIINFIALYPEEKTEKLRGSNLIEKVSYGFGREVQKDPLYMIRKGMWDPPPKDYECLEEVPYAPQLGEATWEAVKEEYSWAQKVDSGVKRVQKATTLNLKIKEKTRVRIKILAENDGKNSTKLRADLLGKGLGKADYIYSKVGIEELTLNIGKYFNKFGERSEVYLELKYGWKETEEGCENWEAKVYFEIPNLSFWKNKPWQKDIKSEALIDTGEIK